MGPFALSIFPPVYLFNFKFRPVQISPSQEQAPRNTVPQKIPPQKSPSSNSMWKLLCSISFLGALQRVSPSGGAARMVGRKRKLIPVSLTQPCLFCKCNLLITVDCDLGNSDKVFHLYLTLGCSCPQRRDPVGTLRCDEF